MTEIERIVWANDDNIDLINRLRDAVGAELARSPFLRWDPPAATAEGAVSTLLDDARVWSRSPRLVSLVTELETLASSFEPNKRVRRLRKLSPEAVAALLDDAPGGGALACPVALADGKVIDRGEPEQVAALLTGRPREDARLLGRLGAAGPTAGGVAAVAIYVLPAADRDRLRALFADPDAPGRGDLAALKKDLDDRDRAQVAAGAARAAHNLKLAFRIRDKQKDHRRGSTVASFLSPAPLARLALTVVDLVLPREEPQLFLGDRVDGGRRHEDRARSDEQVRHIFSEILETARAIAEQTASLRDLDLFCGISVTRRVSDLIAQERALRARDGFGGAADGENDFDRPEAAARRLIESAMQARDTVLLLRGYEATFLAYTGAVLRTEPTDVLRVACDEISRAICGGLLRRYSLALADLDDGIFYWTDVKSRATGSAQPQRWLPHSVATAPVALSTNLFGDLQARPLRLSALDEIVSDIAAEIDGSADQDSGSNLMTDPTIESRSMGLALREAWAALSTAYPLGDFFEKVSGRA